MAPVYCVVRTSIAKHVNILDYMDKLFKSNIEYKRPHYFSDIGKYSQVTAAAELKIDLQEDTREVKEPCV